jgi:hypothetical protein
MALKGRKGFRDGPAISDVSVPAYSTRDMTDYLVKFLESLFETERALFPADAESKEKLRERYQAF